MARQYRTRIKPEAVTLWQVINEKPGLSITDLSGELQVSEGSVTSWLASLERTEMLVCEDDRGGIYPLDYDS